MVVGTADRNLVVFNLQNPQVMFLHLMQSVTDIFAVILSYLGWQYMLSICKMTDIQLLEFLV